MSKNILYPAIGLAYISNGMQLVLLAWLALQVLDLSPLGVSSILALSMLPQVALLPLAGRLADKYPPNQMAKWSCAGLGVSHLVLVASMHVVALHWLTLSFYAIAVGSFGAIFLPSKDKTVVQLLPERLQKAISLSSAFQFLGVLVGSVLAGFVNDLGVTALLILQSMLMAVAASYWHMIPSQNHSAKPVALGFRELVKGNTALTHLLILCAFNGFLHMGFAVALFPELGMEQWDFSAFQYGLMQAAFCLGGVAVYVANAFRAPQQYPGQAVLFCLLYTAGIAYAITRGPTLYGSYGLIFLWGAAAGYSASMSRVLLHSLSGNKERGRLASLYQMVLLAAAPAGSFVCGLIMEAASVDIVLKVIAGLSVAMFAAFLLSRSLWSVKQTATD